jgi:hypothetical protein
MGCSAHPGLEGFSSPVKNHQSNFFLSTNLSILPESIKITNMNVETQTEIKTLGEVCEYLSHVTYIHNGGCAIAALAIARWVKKSPMIASTIFVMGENSVTDFRTNSEALINSDNQPTSCAHVGIIVYDYEKGTQRVFDSKGLFDMTEYSFLTTFADQKHLIKSINRVDHWNETFNRQHVPQIAERLGIDLSDIDLRTKQQYMHDMELDPSVTFEPDPVDEMFKKKPLTKLEYVKKLWELIF